MNTVCFSEFIFVLSLICHRSNAVGRSSRIYFGIYCRSSSARSTIKILIVLIIVTLDIVVFLVPAISVCVPIYSGVDPILALLV